MNQSALRTDILDLIGPDHLNRGSEFVTWWLYEKLPPFCAGASVVGLAAQLKRDAATAGVDLGAITQSRPLAIERLVLDAMNARGWRV